jgi:hypothetical protein
MEIIGPLLCAIIAGGFYCVAGFLYMFLQLLLLKFFVNLLGGFFGFILWIFVEYGICTALVFICM